MRRMTHLRFAPPMGNETSPPPWHCCGRQILRVTHLHHRLRAKRRARKTIVCQPYCYYERIMLPLTTHGGARDVQLET